MSKINTLTENNGNLITVTTVAQHDSVTLTLTSVFSANGTRSHRATIVGEGFEATRESNTYVPRYESLTKGLDIVALSVFHDTAVVAYKLQAAGSYVSRFVV